MIFYLVKEFRVVSIKGYDYELADSDNKTYKISMNFYELKRQPKVGSRVFMSPQLLDKNYYEYSSFYHFGKVGSSCGRSPDAKSYKTDIIEIELDGERMRQQRHYG